MCSCIVMLIFWFSHTDMHMTTDTHTTANSQTLAYTHFRSLHLLCACQYLFHFHSISGHCVFPLSCLPMHWLLPTFSAYTKLVDSLQEAFGDRSPDRPSLFTFMSCWLTSHLTTTDVVSEHHKRTTVELKQIKILLWDPGVEWQAKKWLSSSISFLKRCFCMCFYVKASQFRQKKETAHSSFAVNMLCSL